MNRGGHWRHFKRMWETWQSLSSTEISEKEKSFQSLPVWRKAYNVSMVSIRGIIRLCMDGSNILQERTRGSVGICKDGNSSGTRYNGHTRTDQRLTRCKPRDSCVHPFKIVTVSCRRLNEEPWIYGYFIQASSNDSAEYGQQWETLPICLLKRKRASIWIYSWCSLNFY